MEDNKPTEPVTPPAEETPVVPETPTEELKAPETPAVPETPETTEEDLEIDTTQIEAEVTKKVSEKLVKSLLGGSEEQVTEATGEQSPWAKEGRNPRDYEEIAEWGAHLIEKKQEEAKAQAETQAKAQEEILIKQQELRAKEWNEAWEEQLNELQEEGRIPPILDDKNEHDPGVVARKDLFTKMIEVNENRVKSNKRPTYSLIEMAYKYSNNEEPGMSAPVSIGRGTVPTDDEPYEYVGNKSFFDILKGAVGR